MHGAWGALNSLIKKQNNDKYRKAHIRHELQKRKEKYLQNAYGGLSGYNFPDLSDQEIEMIKGEIRASLKQDEIKNRINSLIIFILVSIAVLYAILMYMQEVERRFNWDQII